MILLCLNALSIQNVISLGYLWSKCLCQTPGLFIFLKYWILISCCRSINMRSCWSHSSRTSHRVSSFTLYELYRCHRQLYRYPRQHLNKMSYISTIPSAFEIRVRALKPWTLPSSVLPILLGTLLAYKSTKPFDPYPFVLCSFVIIGLHTAGNFVNSYYEAKSRVFFTRPLERNAIIYETARCAVATYCIVIPSFGLLLFSSIAYIWQELTLFCVGFIASILFGRCLRNIAVGELAVSAVYGPLCVIFTYAVQVGSRREFNGSWLCLYSLPLALCTECFLHR